MNEASFAVEVENLVKSFGDFVAVDRIHFQVKKGEIFAERSREIHNHTNALRLIDANFRKRKGSGIRHCRRTRED